MHQNINPLVLRSLLVWEYKASGVKNWGILTGITFNSHFKGN
jgi:hypothetical protein